MVNVQNLPSQGKPPHPMIHQSLETEILEKVRGLNASQRHGVLDYIQKIPRTVHSAKRYRSRAMKQIKEALEN